MQGYEYEGNGGQGRRPEPRSSASKDQGWSDVDPCSWPQGRPADSGAARSQEKMRPAEGICRGERVDASEGAGILPLGGRRRRGPKRDISRLGTRLPWGVLFLWMLALCPAGCGDQVRELTLEEKLAFQQAGSVTPVIDMDRIERAILKTGPYRVVPGDILEVTMPVLLQAVTVAEVQSTQRGIQVVNPYLLRVRANGTIALPAVGPMKVAGLPLSEIEERITDAYKDYVIPHPSVFVRVAEYKTARVYVAGAVRTPGVYALQADQMTLSSLLTQAGGVSEAGAAVVRILRSERPAEAAAGTFLDTVQKVASDANDRPEVRARVPNRDASRLGSPPPGETGPVGTLSLASSPSASTATGEPLPTREGLGAPNAEFRVGEPLPPAKQSRWGSDAALGRRAAKPILLPVVNANIPYRDVALDEGDSVVVEPVQMPLFSVLGLVAKPGNFPYPPGARYNLTQAIAFAGGLDRVARPYYVTIYRLKEDGSVARAPFRLLKNDKFTDALGTPIRPGDVVAVENTPRTRLNTAIRDLVRINAGFYISGNDLWNND
jgi:protein involved in polysaccharide export with SLBB domain